MVSAPDAADAVARARRLPKLRIGLHLTLVDGAPTLPPGQIPDLVDESGRFRANMATAGFRFFFLPRVRRQLAAEIRAQFEAFHATGLALDHANAHKHMHVHPTVARLMVEIGRDYGLNAVRVPAEPASILRAAGENAVPLVYAPWVALMRRRFRRAGLAVNDYLLGLRWTGAMTEDRVLRLMAVLPDGVSELYGHPAVAQSPALARLMPHYRPADELAALVSPAVRQAVVRAGANLASYADITPLS